MDPLTTVETEQFGTISVRQRDCPLCGCNNDSGASSRYSNGAWTIKNCPGCRFVYIDRAPGYEMQFEAMAWHRTTKVEEQRRAEIRPLSHKASKRTRFRMHVLPKRTMLGYITRRAGGERAGSRLRRWPGNARFPAVVHTVWHRNRQPGRSCS
jgi:hypothetical protein